MNKKEITRVHYTIHTHTTPPPHKTKKGKTLVSVLRNGDQGTTPIAPDTQQHANAPQCYLTFNKLSQAP